MREKIPSQASDGTGCRRKPARPEDPAGGGAAAGLFRISTGARMKASLVPGVGTTAKLIVDRDRTIDFMGENARVYATPMLVRDIELACRELLLDHLDPGEDSVGTRVEIDHLAATLMGQRVLLRLAVTEVKGRAVTFEVEGSDELDPICRGRHHRFVVDVKKTEERLAAKAAKVASAAKATG